jgi:hypothetical protein
MKRALAALLLAFVLAVAGCGSGPDQDKGSQSQLPELPAEAGPVLPDLGGSAGASLRREVARADQEKMNPSVFAKVGDSNTEWPQNIYGTGCREVGYGSNFDLESTVDRYRKVEFPDLTSLPGCSPVNSLTRRSAAAVSGVWTQWLMTPTEDLPETGIAPPTDECEPSQTPLDCEIDLISPRWVLIMSGTNDALLGRPLGEVYRSELRQMIRRVRELGPVPIVSSLPPMAVPAHNGQPGEERVEEANGIIRELAGQMEVPLIDLHSALDQPQMIDRGLASDGLHLGVYGGEDAPDVMRGSAMLTIPALRYGANRRNLIWLQTLKRLDQAAEAGS